MVIVSKRTTGIVLTYSQSPPSHLSLLKPNRRVPFLRLFLSL